MSSSHCMSQLLWFIFNKVSSQCSWPLTGQKACCQPARPLAHFMNIRMESNHAFQISCFFFCVGIKWNCTFSDFYSLPRIYALCSFFKKENNCVLFLSVFLFLFSNFHYLGLWQLSRRKRIRFESEGIKYTQKLADGDGAKAEYCAGAHCLLWGNFSCHVLPIKVICLSVLLLILMSL